MNTVSHVSPTNVRPEFHVNSLIDFGAEYLLLGTLLNTNSQPISAGEVTGGLMPEYFEKANVLNSSSMVSKMSEDGRVIFVACLLNPMIGDLKSRSLALQLQNRSKVFFTSLSEKQDKVEPREILKRSEPYHSLIERLLQNETTRSKTLGLFFSKLQAVQKYLKNPFVGKFDNVENGLAGGWILNPLNVDERYEVHVMEGFRLVGYGVANLFREDLLHAGKLDGCVAFKVRIANSMYDGKEHQLSIRVKGRRDHAIPGRVLFKGPQLTPRKLVLDYSTKWKLLEGALRTYQDEARWLDVFEIYQKTCLDIESGEYTSALLHLSDLKSLGLHLSIIELLTAEVDYLKGKYQEVKTRLEPALTGDANEALLSYFLALTFKQLSKPSTAFEFVERALQAKDQLYGCLAAAEALHDELTDLTLDDDSTSREKKLARLHKQLLKNPDNKEVTRKISLILHSTESSIDHKLVTKEDLEALDNLRHSRILVGTLLAELQRVVK